MDEYLSFIPIEYLFLVENLDCQLKIPNYLDFSRHLFKKVKLTFEKVRFTF